MILEKLWFYKAEIQKGEGLEAIPPPHHHPQKVHANDFVGRPVHEIALYTSIYNISELAKINK